MTLVRIDPETLSMTMHCLGDPPEWCKVLRMIHLSFDHIAAKESLSGNTLYALASDLVDHHSVKAVVMLTFGEDWKSVTGRRVVPLPTQDCCCHRVAVVGDFKQPQKRSIVVTELGVKVAADYGGESRADTKDEEGRYHARSEEPRWYAVHPSAVFLSSS